MARRYSHHGYGADRASHQTRRALANRHSAAISAQRHGSRQTGRRPGDGTVTVVTEVRERWWTQAASAMGGYKII